jgi:hypothetical protein
LQGEVRQEVGTDSYFLGVIEKAQISYHRNRAESLRVFIDPRVTRRVAFQCVMGRGCELPLHTY